MIKPQANKIDIYSKQGILFLLCCRSLYSGNKLWHFKNIFLSDLLSSNITICSNTLNCIIMTMKIKIFYLTVILQKNIIQNKCHIYTSYRLVWRLLLRQSTLSLSYSHQYNKNMNETFKLKWSPYVKVTFRLQPMRFQIVMETHTHSLWCWALALCPRLVKLNLG